MLLCVLGAPFVNANFSLKTSVSFNSPVEQKKLPTFCRLTLSLSTPAICCLSVCMQVYGFSMTVFANITASVHVHAMCLQALKVQHFVLPSLAYVFNLLQMQPVGVDRERSMYVCARLTRRPREWVKVVFRVFFLTWSCVLFSVPSFEWVLSESVLVLSVLL